MDYSGYHKAVASYAAASRKIHEGATDLFWTDFFKPSWPTYGLQGLHPIVSKLRAAVRSGVSLSHLRDPDTGCSVLDQVVNKALKLVHSGLLSTSPGEMVVHQFQDICDLIAELVNSGVPVLSWDKWWHEVAMGCFTRPPVRPPPWHLDHYAGIDWFSNLQVIYLAGMCSHFEQLSLHGKSVLHYYVVKGAMTGGWRPDRLAFLRQRGASTRVALLDACKVLNDMLAADPLRREYWLPHHIARFYFRLNNALAWHQREASFSCFICCTLSSKLPKVIVDRVDGFLLGTVVDSLLGSLSAALHCKLHMTDGIEDEEQYAVEIEKQSAAQIMAAEAAGDYSDYVSDYDFYEEEEDEEEEEESGGGNMEELETPHIDHGEDVEEERAEQIGPVEAAQVESHLWAGRIEKLNRESSFCCSWRGGTSSHSSYCSVLQPLHCRIGEGASAVCLGQSCIGTWH